MNDRVKILLLMIFYFPIVFIIMGALIFIPANDFSWLFLIIFFSYIIIYSLYSLIKDPDILVKRGKYTTDDPATTFLPDKTFMILAVVVFGFIFIFPGFDYASNISPLPWFIELPGFFGLVISLIGITYVNKVNRYASKD